MFTDIYRGRRVLVTGHTGFKGSWLSLWLTQLGAVVHGFSRDIPTNPSMFEALDLGGKMADHRGEIADGECVRRVFETVQPDFVFHLAAQPIVKLSYEDPVGTFRTNVVGTLNVLDAARLANRPCVLVMITSDKCYENVEWTWGYRENDHLGGKDPYSASKAAAECAIHSMYHSFFKKENRIRVASVRAGNVIGGGDWAANRIVPDCVRSWAREEPVTIRSPQSTRPWQHVLEPLSGYLRVGQDLMATGASTGESFNFGPKADQSRTVLELLETISAGWPAIEGGEKMLVEANPNFHEAGLLKLNCDKALHFLQWQPTLAFEQTTRLTSSWYQRFYGQGVTGLDDFTVGQLDEYVGIASAKGYSWTR